MNRLLPPNLLLCSPYRHVQLKISRNIDPFGAIHYSHRSAVPLYRLAVVGHNWDKWVGPGPSIIWFWCADHQSWGTVLTVEKSVSTFFICSITLCLFTVTAIHSKRHDHDVMTSILARYQYFVAAVTSPTAHSISYIRSMSRPARGVSPILENAIHHARTDKYVSRWLSQSGYRCLIVLLTGWSRGAYARRSEHARSFVALTKC